MYGIESHEETEALNQLEAVLDRQTTVNSLDALISAINKIKINPELETVAIGIDSSVFLRLATYKNKADDIIDYLGTKHHAPLILPGQAIQEFWNNQLAVVDTLSQGIKKKYDQLKQDVSKIDSNFSDYAFKMEELLDGFSTEFGYVYDPSTLHSTSTLFNLLKEKSLILYAPRMRFNDIALNRKKTKTPPGFKDDGDGDFYLWVDFLYGLIKAKIGGKQFTHAVMLTHDKKVDWSRSTTAHPILTAEVQALVDVPFDVWTIDQLHDAITRNSSLEVT